MPKYVLMTRLGPEVLKDPTHHGAKADVYAFGCLMYEVLSGQLPFDPNDSLYNIQRAIVEDAFPPLRSLNAGIPAPLSKS